MLERDEVVGVREEAFGVFCVLGLLERLAEFGGEPLGYGQRGRQHVDGLGLVGVDAEDVCLQGVEDGDHVVVVEDVRVAVRGVVAEGPAEGVPDGPYLLPGGWRYPDDGEFHEFVARDFHDVAFLEGDGSGVPAVKAGVAQFHVLAVAVGYARGGAFLPEGAVFQVAPGGYVAHARGVVAERPFAHDKAVEVPVALRGDLPDVRFGFGECLEVAGVCLADVESGLVAVIFGASVFVEAVRGFRQADDLVCLQLEDGLEVFPAHAGGSYAHDGLLVCMKYNIQLRQIMTYMEENLFRH